MQCFTAFGRPLQEAPGQRHFGATFITRQFEIGLHHVCGFSLANRTCSLAQSCPPSWCRYAPDSTCKCLFQGCAVCGTMRSMSVPCVSIAPTCAVQPGCDPTNEASGSRAVHPCNTHQQCVCVCVFMHRSRRGLCHASTMFGCACMHWHERHVNC